MEVIIDFVNKILANPLHIVMVLFVVYRIWSQFQPFPEQEGGPEAIQNMQDWETLQKDKKDSVIIVDFYATWCGPCKTAAPVFHKMSQEVEFGNIVFRKVDVDKAADVAKACEISAMPTFKLFRGGKVIETIQGWNESKLREALRKAAKD